MIGLLQAILCILRNILLAIAWGAVEVVNALVKAIGALATLILALCPPMPDMPAPPDDGVMVWVAWVLPIGPLVAVFFICVSLWVTWLLLQAALRWVRAIK